jgi:hypothetical protein
MSQLTQDLGTAVFDQDTIGIQITITDEAGDPLTPNSPLHWTLTDVNGSIINDRDAETITPASTITIVLTGADLDYADGAGRLLRLHGTYDSDLGSDLNLNRQYKFAIENVTDQG